MKKSAGFLLTLFAALCLSATATAGTIDNTDLFYEFYEFINTNMGGGLGLGLALMAFLIGVAIAAVTLSYQPMLGGIIVAIGLKIGDDIITDMVIGSAIMSVDSVNQFLSTASSVI